MADGYLYYVAGGSLVPVRHCLEVAPGHGGRVAPGDILAWGHGGHSLWMITSVRGDTLEMAPACSPGRRTCPACDILEEDGWVSPYEYGPEKTPQLEEEGPPETWTAIGPPLEEEDAPLKVGDRVSNPAFGNGTVTGVPSSGPLLKVRFDRESFVRPVHASLLNEPVDKKSPLLEMDLSPIEEKIMASIPQARGENQIPVSSLTTEGETEEEVIISSDPPLPSPEVMEALEIAEEAIKGPRSQTKPLLGSLPYKEGDPIWIWLGNRWESGYRFVSADEKGILLENIMAETSPAPRVLVTDGTVTSPRRSRGWHYPGGPPRTVAFHLLEDEEETPEVPVLFVGVDFGKPGEQMTMIISRKDPDGRITILGEKSGPQQSEIMACIPFPSLETTPHKISPEKVEDLKEKVREWSKLPAEIRVAPKTEVPGEEILKRLEALQEALPSKSSLELRNKAETLVQILKDLKEVPPQEFALQTIVEALADLEHRRWSRWMEYLFGKSNPFVTATGEQVMCIPERLVERWERQLRTPYLDLSEEEKESDRKEARRTIRVLLNVGALPPRFREVLGEETPDEEVKSLHGEEEWIPEVWDLVRFTKDPRLDFGEGTIIERSEKIGGVEGVWCLVRWASNPENPDWYESKDLGLAWKGPPTRKEPPPCKKEPGVYLATVTSSRGITLTSKVEEMTEDDNHWDEILDGLARPKDKEEDRAERYPEYEIIEKKIYDVTLKAAWTMHASLAAIAQALELEMMVDPSGEMLEMIGTALVGFEALKPPPIPDHLLKETSEIDKAQIKQWKKGLEKDAKGLPPIRGYDENKERYWACGSLRALKDEAPPLEGSWSLIDVHEREGEMSGTLVSKVFPTDRLWKREER